MLGSGGCIRLLVPRNEYHQLCEWHALAHGFGVSEARVWLRWALGSRPHRAASKTPAGCCPVGGVPGDGSGTGLPLGPLPGAVGLTVASSS